MVIDSSGAAYVTGKTESSGISGTTTFPTTAGVTQPSPGGNGSTDAFVSKINAVRHRFRLLDLPRWPGPGLWERHRHRLAGTGLCDRRPRATTGTPRRTATSPITASAYEDTNTYFVGGGQDAFLTRLNASGQRDYSTMLGGEGNDSAQCGRGRSRRDRLHNGHLEHDGRRNRTIRPEEPVRGPERSVLLRQRPLRQQVRHGRERGRLARLLDPDRWQWDRERHWNPG